MNENATNTDGLDRITSDLLAWAEAVRRILDIFGDILSPFRSLPPYRHPGPNMYSKAKRRGPMGHRRGR